MIVDEWQKPAVLLYAAAYNSRAAAEICAGLEEEGIPCRLCERQSGGVYTLAYAAANDSLLHCGIGLCGARAAMTLDNLRENDMLFETSCDWKTLGTNAARAVKKIRFKAIDADRGIDRMAEPGDRNN